MSGSSENKIDAKQTIAGHIISNYTGETRKNLQEARRKKFLTYGRPKIKSRNKHFVLKDKHPYNLELSK